MIQFVEMFKDKFKDIFELELEVKEADSDATGVPREQGMLYKGQKEKKKEVGEVIDEVKKEVKKKVSEEVGKVVEEVEKKIEEK